MGLWDVLRGQSRPRPPQLDQLFAIPSAALTLESGLGLRPSGEGSVCFRAAQGPASGLAQDEAAALVAVEDGLRSQSRVDEFGYTWVTVRTDPPDPAALVTHLHAVNASLELEGFGPGLLCSTVEFVDQADNRCYLVYLYKRGTFYPFCPTSTRSRDSIRERQVRDAVGTDLPVEPDTARWMPIWGVGEP